MNAKVDVWIFDLDNTLYRPELGLLDQINQRITGFLMRELRLTREAAELYRRDSWLKHGITLGGLIADHGTDPAVYLADTHDIDYGGVVADRALREAVTGCAGRRIIHTNGARLHAERVLDALGIADLFEGVWAIEDSGIVPKPKEEAFTGLREAMDFDPARAVMVEDSLANLRVPKALGMTTVWTRPAPLVEKPHPEHVDHAVDDLVSFLGDLASGRVSLTADPA